MKLTFRAKILQKELEEIKTQNTIQEKENMKDKEKNIESSTNKINSITLELNTSKIEIERLRKELDQQILLVTAITASGSAENAGMVEQTSVYAKQIDVLTDDKEKLQKVS